MKHLLILNDPPYGAARSTMDELAEATLAADRVLVF
jgi:sulfur relay (sulfurtransferase) complex TusBCD TusD component (DsrE family)